MSQIDVFTLGETMVLFQPDQMAPLDYVSHFPKRLAEQNPTSQLALHDWVIR